MKITILSLICLAAAVPSALAFPYTARPLPAGFNAAFLQGDAFFNRFTQQPMAADFLRNGTLQWYAGGSVITRFPESGSVTLPAITLSLAPASTVVPLAGVPCDVDADGDMDIVRINEWSGHSFRYTLQVFLNNGVGGFTAGYRFDWDNNLGYDGGRHVFQIVPGDFDSDGYADFAVLETYEFTNYNPDPYREEGRLIMRWNDRSAGFASTTTLQSTGFDADALASAADMDRDGDLDLVCSDHQTWSNEDLITGINTRFFTNNGNKTFSSSALSQRPSQFTDVNRDGWPDVGNSWAMAINGGDGSLINYYQVAGGGSKAFVYADADGDALPDLVRGEGNAIVYYRGSGDGGFAATPVTMATLSGPALAVNAADSDTDGDSDFFVTLDGGGFVFVENRSLHLVPSAYVAASMNLSGATGLHSADFNLDGKADLLAVTPSQKKLWFMFGDNGGISTTGLFKNTQGEAPHSAAVADYDHDSRPDVVYTLPSTGVVRMARNTGSVPFSWTDTAIATGLPGVSLCVPGQLGTANGKRDVLTCNGTTGQFRWLYESTGGTWTGLNVLSTISPAPGSIAAVQAASGAGDEPFFLAGNASNLYLRGYQLAPSWIDAGTPRVEFVTGGPHASAMVWADAGKSGKNAFVFITGDGSLGVYNPINTARYNLGTAPGGLRDIVAVDWDRNGYTDFLCATGNGLSLFCYNRSTTLWDRTELITQTGGFQKATVLDFDRDGYMDAAAADAAKVYFIRNNPHILETSRTSPAAVNLPVGKTGTALTFTAESAGRATPGTWLNDADAVFTGAQLTFQRAVASGNNWVPGSPLSQSELTAVVSAIHLMGNSTVIGSTGPSALQAGGILNVNYHPVLGNPVNIPPGGILSHTIRLNVTPGALQSANPRFFVSLNWLTGAELDGVTPVTPGTGLPVRLGGNQPILVTTVPDYTPLQAWRADYFGAPDGTGLRANDADFDKDGVPNIVEYLAGTDPTLTETALNATNGLTMLKPASVQSLVKFQLVMNNDAGSDPKLRVTIQQSTNLTTWTTQSSRTGLTSWTGSQPVSTSNSTSTTALFTPGFTHLSTPKFYLRLKVEELP